MPFLSNGAINRVNLHFAVATFAQQLGGVFVFVFLLKAGTSIPLVLLTVSGMNAGRFLLRPAVLASARRIGLRRNVMLGALMEAAVFPILPHIHGPGTLLIAYSALSALGSVFYWTSYHAFFAAVGDAEGRGGQIGAREALAAVVGVVAPGIGGWALATAGPEALFWAAAAVQALAVLPLIGAPDVSVPREAPGGFRAARLAATLMATDGLLASSVVYVWQIALFVSLGEGFASYGGAMALAGLLGAVGTMALGRLIDMGHARRSVALAYGLVAAGVVLKAAGVTRPWLAVLANALGAICATLQAPAMMTLVYNLAKRSPCPLRFHMATEAGWDAGCCFGCGAAAVMVRAGAPLSAPLLLGLAGAAAAALLLIRSYSTEPAFRAAS